MYTLVVVRHAKSDHTIFGIDFERPLNERGKRDAPIMAQRLKTKLPGLQLFVSSPAKRALETAMAFVNIYGKPENEIVQVKQLYNAPAEVFYDVIDGLPCNAASAALFAHNPGITNFINGLVKDNWVDNMPTCSIFAVEADCKDWAGFRNASKRLLFFDYPKLQA